MTQPLSMADLATALTRAAELVAIDDRVLPIYERLEEAFLLKQRQEDTLARARALANTARQRVLQAV